MKRILLAILLVSSALHAQTQQHSSNECYVRLKKSVTEQSDFETIKQLLVQLSFPYSIEVKESFKVSKSEALKRTYRIKCNELGVLDSLILQLNNKSDVEYAEHIQFAQRFITPNDLLPNTVGNNGQWYLYKIKAQQAWDLQTGDSTISVAICDDAFDINHPDMQGVFKPGADVAEFDTDVTPPTADFDHGTFIAGLIAANTNNNQGIASLAHGVKIIPIKIANDFDPTQASYGLEGINEAVNRNADVINVSWGFSELSQSLLSVVGNAISAGIPIIAAAGNTGDITVNYPAGCLGVISVASTTNTDARSNFSTYGSSIDISAPGSSLFSTKPGGLYTVKSGTSFSAPLVTAAVALMLSQNSELSNEQIISCLRSGADNIDIFNPSAQGLLGAGRLNVQQTLNCLVQANAEYDGEVLSILNPVSSSCNTNFSPVIRIRNNGSQPITSLEITYQLDTNFPLQYTWNGNIAQGQVQLLTLNSLNAPVGNHSLKITLTSLLNQNQTDAYLGNNSKITYFKILSSTGQSLPYNEDFESGSFLTNNWTIENPSTDFSWEIAEVSGNSPGGIAARLPYYIDFESGSRDYLMTPTFNFSGYDSISLDFDFAYKERTFGITDSLILSVSTDCGENWIRLMQVPNYEDPSGGLITSVSGADFFVPVVSADWCGLSYAQCRSFDLTNFAGITNVRFRFEGYNGNGNNIYIDNISIYGQLSNEPPIANFNADGNQGVCQNRQVTFNNTSLNLPTTYQWFFEGGVPSSSNLINPTITYNTPGNYDVKLVAINQNGIDSLLLDNYITIYPIPEVLAIASPDSICRGNSASLIATGAAQYQWNSASGLTNLIGDTITASPFNSANYTVTGVSEEGCTALGTTSLTVLLPPVQPIISLSGVNLIATPASSHIWYLNGVELPDSDTSLWTPVSNGNYNVRIFDEYGCTSISVIYNINFVGLANLENISTNIYPNPANNRVFIKMNGIAASLKLYSIEGQFLKEVYNINEFDLNGFANGTYLLHITNENEELTIKRLIVYN
jgi:PKD repeat protein